MATNVETPGVKSVIFTNWTKENFAYPEDAHCRWDGIPYSFKKGSKTTLPDYLAAHFAKHLVNRELNKLAEDDGQDGGPGVYNDTVLRTAMINRCYADNISEEAVEKAEEDLKDKLLKMNKDKLIKAAKKAGVEFKKKDTKDEIADAIVEKEEGENKDEGEFEGNE